MKGRVLGFDGNEGAISGEDGQRYAFYAADWKSSAVAQAGDPVDFVAEGNMATSVYAASAPAPAGNTPRAGFDPAQIASARRYLAGRPQVILAGLIVIASIIFNFIAVAANPLAGGGAGVSLLGTPGAVGNLARAFGGGFSGIQVIGYLLWLLPAFALALIWLDHSGKRNQRLELGLGAGAIASLVYVALVRQMLVSAMGPLGGLLSGVATALISPGLGAWLIALCGVGLVLTGLGRLTRTPGL